MNDFLNKLERRFGRYAIPDLIRYMVAIYCLGAAIGFAGQIGVISQTFYYEYLSLNMEDVLHGQVWRLFTYLLEPYDFGTGGSFLINVLFFFVEVNLFFLFGRSLEQAWGTFRFNLYILSGFLLNILAALVLYLSPVHFKMYGSGFEYIYWTMFFAFALYNPDMEFLLYFVLPIKVKWLAVADAVFLGYSIFKNVANGIELITHGETLIGELCLCLAVAIVIAMANFLVFFFATRDFQRIRPRERKRRRDFRRDVRQGTPAQGQARHRCAICGRTELDAPQLDFRYCSKCEGNYEYCSEHLFTHQHVKKIR